jgi:hypothetical protein
LKPKAVWVLFCLVTNDTPHEKQIPRIQKTRKRPSLRSMEEGRKIRPGGQGTCNLRCLGGSPMSKNRHAAALGKKGGKVGGLSRSPAKTAAAQANGRKGGRPKKYHQKKTHGTKI